jgi:hypothetical protein
MEPLIRIHLRIHSPSTFSNGKRRVVLATARTFTIKVSTAKQHTHRPRFSSLYLHIHYGIHYGEHNKLQAHCSGKGQGVHESDRSCSPSPNRLGEGG